MADATNTAVTAEGAGPVEGSAALVRVMTWVDRWGVLLLVVIMGAISWALQPDLFFKERNIFNIFRQTSPFALLALGQFVVIVTAGIDLSIGSILALGMMTMAVTYTNVPGMPWPILVAVPFVVGAAVGTVNGLGLTRLHMPHPFIMTLGMMFIARGLTNIISGGVPISGLPTEVRFVGSADIDVAGFEVPVVLFAVIASYTVVWAFLQHARLGRHIFAIGGNPQAARVSGINVDRTLVIAYAICGLLAGFAGLVVVGRTGSAFPNAGEGDELYAISAVIIGGASFFGGRGTVLGVFAGVLVIGMLRNLLNLNNVHSWYQQVLIGGIIIAVVAFDVFRRRVTASS